MDTTLQNTSVQELRRQAAELAKQQRWDRSAVEINEAILAREPNDVSAMLRLATYHEQYGPLGVAIAHWRRVLEIDPRNRIAINRMQDLSDYRARLDHPAPAPRGRRPFSEARTTAAASTGSTRVAACRRMLALALTVEDQVKAQTMLGAALRDVGDLHEAAAAYRAALALDAGDPVTLVGAAAVEVDLGHLAAAEELANCALVRGPGSAAALWMLSKVQWKRGDRDKAFGTIMQAAYSCDR